MIKNGHDDVVDLLLVEWKRRLPKLFTGKVGKLKDHMVELHIDEKVTPVQQKLRHVPFHQREAVEMELKMMLEQDLIEPVVGPTPWVLPLNLILC
jgi:hypothetical protein